MLRVTLCWDENGRNVVVRRDVGDRAVWAGRLYALASADIEKDVLSPDLVDQLDTFGSAALSAVDERALVRRLVASPSATRQAA